MKKLVFTALIAVSLVSSAFAADVKTVNNKVVSAFEAHYGDASKVKWTVNAGIIKASVVYNSKSLEVFYDVTGEEIGTSRTITVDQLPTRAKRAFAQKYAGYNVTEAIQFETNGDITYYLGARNDKESLILEVKGGSVRVFKKTNKS